MSAGTTDAKLIELADAVGKVLQLSRLVLATAESCTGGWVAQAITSIAGSSAWFDRGFVTYSNQSKQDLLGVSREALENYGAVSDPVVKAMVDAALTRSRADVALAITGIAGPDGGTPEKPVGTVWIAWQRKTASVAVRRAHFAGDRAAVRWQAVAGALSGLLEYLESH